MINIYKYFILSIFIIGINYGQSLKRSDFNIGLFDLDVPPDAILKYYGEPINEELSDGDLVYYYPNCTIWVDEMNNKIGAFQIFQFDFNLSRGICISDSLQKLTKLFGLPDEFGEKFDGGVSGYDFRFTDYSNYFEYYFKTDKYNSHFNEYNYWNIIFYLKRNIIVRILYYIEIFE